MQRFIYGNADFALAISQRKMPPFNKWSRAHFNKNEIEEIVAGKHPHIEVPRRVALNIENARTIEFRIFRGNLKPSSFFRSLEFCHACVVFVKSIADEEIDKLTVANFNTFVGANRDEYPNLFDYLEAGCVKKAKAKAGADE